MSKCARLRVSGTFAIAIGADTRYKRRVTTRPVMPAEIQCDIFLSRSAKDKALVRARSLSASNIVPRLRERERVAGGRVRVVGRKQTSGARAGVRCRIRSSPVNKANYAWIQHFIHHLSPVGVAGFVMANGSMSSNQSGESEVHQQWRAKYDPAN